LDLVAEVGEAGEPGEAPADGDERPELPRGHVLARAGDVPPAREDQARPRLGMIENRLRGPGRVPVHAARDEDDEDSVAARDGPAEYVGCVGGAGHARDAGLEPGELGDALLAAHRHDLVPAVQGELHHVPADLTVWRDEATSHRAATMSR